MKSERTNVFIDVPAARNLVRTHILPPTPTLQPLSEAGGLLLAADVIAPYDIPAFDQSSMDGYAFVFANDLSTFTLPIEGASAAGEPIKQLSKGTTMRIFTGAAVPQGADTIVMQEKTTVVNGFLQFDAGLVKKGDHIRPPGSEIKASEIALPTGTLLTPAANGFLAGIGINAVMVHPMPSVALIITGNELQKPGKPLQEGQVYEANSYTLTLACKQAGIAAPTVFYAQDSLDATVATLRDAIRNYDFVLLTGGISVGDHDYVLAAADACNVRQVFHKVKQRPGKPLYFGMKDTTAVFGLPGNPSSVLSCFYQYVLPAFEVYSRQKRTLPVYHLPLTTEWEKPAGLTHFLKGYYDGTAVTILHAQESYRLHSFARANCLVELDENSTRFTKGQKMPVHVWQPVT